MHLEVEFEKFNFRDGLPNYSYVSVTMDEKVDVYTDTYRYVFKPILDFQQLSLGRRRASDAPL